MLSIYKKKYSTPTSEILELKTQGMLCVSTQTETINALSGTLNGYSKDNQVWY